MRLYLVNADYVNLDDALLSLQLSKRLPNVLGNSKATLNTD